MAGAPRGNQNARKALRVREAFLRALARDAGSIDVGLDKICDEIVKMAATGASEDKKWAIGTIFDRVEGRPQQAVALSGDEDNPVNLIHRIALVAMQRTGNDSSTEH